MEDRLIADRLQSFRRPYYYCFQYVDGDSKLDLSFPAEIDITILKENLKMFLIAAGWQEESVNNLFNKDEE